MRLMLIGLCFKWIRILRSKTLWFFKCKWIWLRYLFDRIRTRRNYLFSIFKQLFKKRWRWINLPFVRSWIYFDCRKLSASYSTLLNLPKQWIQMQTMRRRSLYQGWRILRMWAQLSLTWWLLSSLSSSISLLSVNRKMRLRFSCLFLRFSRCNRKLF